METNGCSYTMFSRLRRTTQLPIGLCQRYFSSKFAVRRVGTPQEVRDIIIEKAKTEGWRPGSFDHVSYFAADNNGFFVGELDREPISCISAVKYSSNLSFLGSYIVDKNYRGKGYGLQTWKVALASLSESCNMGGDAVVENLPLYRRFGLEPYWEEQRFQFVASEVSKALVNFNVTDKTIEMKSTKVQTLGELRMCGTTN